MSGIKSVGINLTKLVELYKKDKSLKFFSVSKNSEVFVNASLWENEPDKFGNSIQITVFDKEKNVKEYIANGKVFENKPKSDIDLD